MIKALFFDMDGVLVDSEDVSITIGIRYFESIGVKATRKDFEPHLGTGMRDFFTGPADDLGIADWKLEDAVEYSRKHYEKVALESNIAFPGAREAVLSAKRSGFMVAVCSSAPLWKVEVNLKCLGMSLSDFNLVVSQSDIRRNKPYGDIYTLALIKLGLSPEEALVFEDSFGGIQAGRNAGIRTVGLTTTIDSERAFLAGADAVISDISILQKMESPEDLASLLFDEEKKDYSYTRYGVNTLNPLAFGQREGILIEKAIEKAWKARDNAHAPYSHFKVGASLVSAATGRIYSGCNVENSSYGGTICAERNAITTAVAEEGNLGIEILVVVSDDDPPAPPCALCLQVMAEFAKEDTRVILVDRRNRRVEYRFSELLPHPFIFPSLR